MLEDIYPVQWADDQAVVTLPPHIGVSNAGQVRDELLSVINRGAMTLIADMTATISCDLAGADAVIRAWQRAVSSGTELRLAVTAGNVLRVLDLRGLSRQVSIYPSLEAAVAARLPAEAAVPVPAPHKQTRSGQRPEGARVASLMPGGLPEAPQDGAALANGDGMIVAVSAALEAMFGYGPGEVLGLPAESLVPGGPQGAHRVGLRKDGTTFQVRVSLTPVATVDEQLTIAVVRDITVTERPDDLLALARDAAAEHLMAQQEHIRLLDAVITGLFHAGLSLQTATGLPADAARQRTEAVLGELDNIIRQIRDTAFTEHRRGVPVLPAPRAPDE